MGKCLWQVLIEIAAFMLYPLLVYAEHGEVLGSTTRLLVDMATVGQPDWHTNFFSKIAV